MLAESSLRKDARARTGRVAAGAGPWPLLLLPTMAALWARVPLPPPPLPPLPASDCGWAGHASDMQGLKRKGAGGVAGVGSMHRPERVGMGARNTRYCAHKAPGQGCPLPCSIH